MFFEHDLLAHFDVDTIGNKQTHINETFKEEINGTCEFDGSSK